MLIALTGSGDRTLAGPDITADAFHCPGCAAELSMRLRPGATPHFAHRPGTACGHRTGQPARRRPRPAARTRALAAHLAAGDQLLFPDWA